MFTQWSESDRKCCLRLLSKIKCPQISTELDYRHRLGVDWTGPQTNACIVTRTVLSGIMSWFLVIPFDVVKTVVQAEVNPAKHGDMVQIFISKTRVNFACWNIRPDFFGLVIKFCFSISEIWERNFLPWKLDHSAAFCTNEFGHIFR